MRGYRIGGPHLERQNASVSSLGAPFSSPKNTARRVGSRKRRADLLSGGKAGHAERLWSSEGGSGHTPTPSEPAEAVWCPPALAPPCQDPWMETETSLTGCGGRGR